MEVDCLLPSLTPAQPPFQTKDFASTKTDFEVMDAALGNIWANILDSCQQFPLTSS